MEDNVGMGEVVYLRVGVRVASPGGFLSEFHVPESLVSANFGFYFSARPHPGFKILVVICDCRDVTDDNLGPGDVLLESDLILLQFQSLDDGDSIAAAQKIDLFKYLTIPMKLISHVCPLTL